MNRAAAQSGGGFVMVIVDCGPSPDVADRMRRGDIDLGMLILDRKPRDGETIGFDPI